MESSRLTLPVILNTLRQTNDYKNLNDYYIKKKIGEKVGVKNANKQDLLNELNRIQSTSQLEPILPIDVYNHILYHSDIDTIYSLCVTNKALTKMCHHASFWKSIFDRDGLFIVDHPSSFDDYVVMYKKMRDAATEVKGIMNVIHYYDIKKLTVSIKKSDLIVDKIKRNVVNDILYAKIRQRNNVDIVFEINKTVRMKVEQTLDYVSIPKIPIQDFISILQKLLYYYPTLEIHTIIMTKKMPFGSSVNLRKENLSKYSSDAPYKKIPKEDGKNRQLFHQQVLDIFNQ